MLHFLLILRISTVLLSWTIGNALAENTEIPYVAKSSAEDYFVKTFELDVENEESVKATGFNISRTTLDTLKQSFFRTGFLLYEILNTGNNMHSVRWQGTPKDISQGESLLRAELKLYRRLGANKSSTTDPITITINAASLMQHNANGVLEVVDSLDSTTSGWVTFNVTKYFERWMNTSNAELGLYVSVGLPSGSRQTINLDDFGIVGPTGDPLFRPFVTANFENAQKPHFDEILASLKRNVDSRPSDIIKRNHKRNINEKKVDHSCHRHEFIINFAEIGLDNIIRPEQYNAYVCRGSCSFPFAMSPTWHATFLSLAHLYQIHGACKPKCTPEKFNSIDVLDAETDGRITQRRLSDAIVAECACT